jgi:hypothetical protein
MYKVIPKGPKEILGYDLTKEIIDIDNRSQLVAKTPSIIERLKAISGYTDYEQSYPEPEIVYVPIETAVPGGDYGSSTSSGGLIAMFGGDEYDPYEGLYQGT